MVNSKEGGVVKDINLLQYVKTYYLLKGPKLAQNSFTSSRVSLENFLPPDSI